MVYLSESMRSGLSKSELNVFRNILVMSKSEIIKKYPKNICINPLGTEIGQNHLSILKWSLNKHWSSKVWTLSFQMPCRTHFPSPGSKAPSYQMKKMLTYILKYFLRTGGYRFYTLLFLKWLRLLPKGQQNFPTFFDLKDQDLSYIQLFSELPETIWSL